MTFVRFGFKLFQQCRHCCTYFNFLNWYCDVSWIIHNHSYSYGLLDINFVFDQVSFSIIVAIRVVALTTRFSFSLCLKFVWLHLGKSRFLLQPSLLYLNEIEDHFLDGDVVVLCILLCLYFHCISHFPYNYSNIHYPWNLIAIFNYKDTTHPIQTNFHTNCIIYINYTNDDYCFLKYFAYVND